jgi:large subunit ribosomal protein L6
MSRVGKYPVVVPAGVELSINNNTVTAKGKLGELSFTFDDSHVNAKLEDGKVTVSPLSRARSQNGLSFSVLCARINQRQEDKTEAQ